MQASLLQKIREVFHKAVSFVPEERKTVHCLKSLLENQAHVSFVPLSVSQLAALEQYDRGKISGGSDFQIMSRPHNDATNACSFLCLGIIDRFSSEDLQTFGKERFAAIVESIILDFPREVNKVRDYSMMPEIREAYDILSRNKLLNHVFDFIEIFVDNYEVYSFELQSKFLHQLQTEKDSSIERYESSFMVFHIGVHVFVISVLKSGEYIVYKTHPIGQELSGNGNGIIVKTFCKYELSQWVMRRCILSRIESSAIPHLLHVTSSHQR